MKTKNKPVKVLIVTQIHPLNVAYVYDEICRSFGEENDIFSPQIMALLGELSLKENADDTIHSYRVLNAAFVKNIHAAIQKMNPLKPWVFIGNCSKNTKIKFDHIVGFDGGEDFGNKDIFDYYIHKDNALLTEKNLQIDYYTKEDVEYFFPTIQHLKLFLSTVGVKGEIADESKPQPSANESDIQH